MQLTVLGSESAGNCYLLSTDTEVLILEAGLRVQVLKQALQYDISKVVGCVVTHRHGDHFKYAGYYAKYGINIYSSKETISTWFGNHRGYSVEPGLPFKLGQFTIVPFEVPHGVYCFGYLISHPETGKILFVTDAAYIPNKFMGLNHILVEANYSDETMVNDRAVGHHMSLDTCMQFLQSNDMTRVYNIILLHLSSSNSHAENFKKSIQSIAPNATINIADKGLQVQLIKNPF